MAPADGMSQDTARQPNGQRFLRSRVHVQGTLEGEIHTRCGELGTSGIF